MKNLQKERSTRPETASQDAEISKAMRQDQDVKVIEHPWV